VSYERELSKSPVMREPSAPQAISKSSRYSAHTSRRRPKEELNSLDESDWMAELKRQAVTTGVKSVPGNKRILVE
jgi:hypothetical protein